MTFSSLLFLFSFLPTVLILYYILKDKFKNYILLLASLFFYAWGEPVYIYLMILSILINYVFGIKVSSEDRNKKRFWFVLSVVTNIGILIIFKYTNFFVDSMNLLIGTNIYIPKIALPLGISFFTFQTMSYVIDVYKNEGKVQKNILNLALYISLFPQLVAGPIVRYQTVDNQISKRNHSIEKFAEGVNRFVIGLGKKVIFSNQLGIVADGIFSTQIAGISVLEGWLGIICYTLQIYFDFSGYSDMAIGLGKMFGFDFLENFNYPYVSQSVSEFWRRWHISLGSWFRDYVYIPLGGNRVNILKQYRNLFVVWFLTGIWHGANLTFIVWGLYFGAFIALEKALLQRLLNRVPRFFRHVYLILIVIIGWIFFRSENLNQAIDFIKVLFGIGSNEIINSAFLIYINDSWLIIVLGILLSTTALKKILGFIKSNGDRLLENSIVYLLHGTSLTVLMFIIVLFLVNSTYNPFLYFRF